MFQHTRTLTLSNMSASSLLIPSCLILLLATGLCHFYSTIFVSSYSQKKICAILYCTLLVSSNLQQQVCVILYSSHLVSSYSIQQVWFTLLVPLILSSRSASFSSLLLLSCLSLRSTSFVTLLFFPHLTLSNISGHIAQLVMCLATDKCLTPNPGAVSSSSMVIFFPSAESFKKSCCQLQARVCARVLVDFAQKMYC